MRPDNVIQYKSNVSKINRVEQIWLYKIHCVTRNIVMISYVVLIVSKVSNMTENFNILRSSFEM